MTIEIANQCLNSHYGSINENTVARLRVVLFSCLNFFGSLNIHLPIELHNDTQLSISISILPGSLTPPIDIIDPV